MLLLNSKSILNCLNEEEEKNHKKEVERIMETIYSMPDYRVILRYRFVDEAHQRNIDMFTHSNLHNFLESIDGIDCKNGYDLTVKDHDTLTVVIYGQHYLLKNVFHIVETHVDVLPFNIQNDFVNIIPYLFP